MNVLDLKGMGSHIIGIDIGNATLKIALLKMSQAPSLSFYSIMDISKDSSDKYIAQLIQKTLSDKGTSAKDAVLTFSDESITIRRMELPQMAPGEILDAVKWQIRDLVHFDLEKICIDFELLGETQKDDGSKVMELLVVVASKEVVDKKVQLLKNAGLNVISINIAPFAIENVIKLSEEIDPSNTVMLVDVGRNKTEMSIFKNKTLEFVRFIPVGSENITDAMTANLTLENGTKVELTRDEAENIKTKVGIPYEETMLEKGIASIQILSLMRPVLEWLSKEIRRSIEYYVQEYGGENTASIYLVGGGARLKNLDVYLSEELKAPVKKMFLPTSIDSSKANLKPEDSASLVSLVGAVLGYRGHLNLLPHEYKMEKVEFIEKISLRMIAVIMAVVLLFSFLIIKFRIADYKYRLKNIIFQKSILYQVKDLQDRVSERMVLLNKLKQSTISLERVMKELSNIIPQNVVLESLNISEKNKSLDMKGLVYGPRNSAEEILTKFTEALERTRYFKDAQSSSIQDRTTGSEEMSSFDITCTLE